VVEDLRYFAYISRSKVGQLYDQIIAKDLPDSYQESRSTGPVDNLFSTNTIDAAESRFLGKEVGDSVIAKLTLVLNYLEKNNKIQDLNELMDHKGKSVELNQFCYRYKGMFTAIGTLGRNEDSRIYLSASAFARSGDDLILSKNLFVDPARQENSYHEIGPNESNLVSDICIIRSKVGQYVLQLSCSYKYFGEMGGHYSEYNNEWQVAPHSGNHHFFAGDVDTWFDTIIFINGTRHDAIMGSPLVLSHIPQPGTFVAL
jgi:Family of unknown function (DUF7019)